MWAISLPIGFRWSWCGRRRGSSAFNDANDVIDTALRNQDWRASIKLRIVISVQRVCAADFDNMLGAIALSKCEAILWVIQTQSFQV